MPRGIPKNPRPKIDDPKAAEGRVVQQLKLDPYAAISAIRGVIAEYDALVGRMPEAATRRVQSEVVGAIATVCSHTDLTTI